MKTASLKFGFTVLIISLTQIQTIAQTRSFNQNASRSNHTRSSGTGDQWVFGISSGYSGGVRSNEASLFRGSSIATKTSAAYYFGSIGLNFSTGVAAGGFSDKAIEDFLIERKYQQLQPIISKSNPLNSYFLFGPAFRFGERIVVNADLQGGLFINDPGGFSIRQQGVDRALYGFEGGSKKMFAGFGGNISIAYPLNSTSQFFITTEYLQSRSTVSLVDLQRGVDVATQQTRDVRLMNIGIGIKKSFGKPNTQSVARNNSGMPSAQPYKHAINNKGTGGVNGRTMNQENCGPVTVKRTNPDGTVEERTFSCPQDAANYDSPLRNEMPARIIHRDIAARNIISGRLGWISPTANGTGIVTNDNVKAARQTPNTSFGQRITIGIRETESGKDKSLKKYGIILADQGNSFTSALGNINQNPLYQGSSISGENPLYEGQSGTAQNPLFEKNATNTNPLYEASGASGQNPMAERKGIQENGIRGLSVALVDQLTQETVAVTTTSSTGEFFFANVPDGSYAVKLSGVIVKSSGYDLTATSQIDLLGEIQQGDGQLQLLLNTEDANQEGNNFNGNGVPVPLDDQKIKTKSNIKNDRLMSPSGQTPAVNAETYSKILSQSLFDVNGDGTVETVAGNIIPEGSASGGEMMRPGTPIGGIVVKGGKNPGGNLRTVQTNDKGGFEFEKLDAGNYKLLVEQTFVINDESIISLDNAARKGWDGTVKGGSIAGDAAERKGWDGTVKGGSITGDAAERKGWDGSVKGSGSVTGDAAERKGWDGSVKGSGKITADYLVAMNELDALLGADKKSSINDLRTAKENSTRLKNSVERIDAATDNNSMNAALTAADTNFAILMGSLTRLGASYATVANVLKTKHDTAKNSIRNMR
jgi:hypothetical protein